MPAVVTGRLIVRTGCHLWTDFYSVCSISRHGSSQIVVFPGAVYAGKEDGTCAGVKFMYLFVCTGLKTALKSILFEGIAKGREVVSYSSAISEALKTSSVSRCA